MSNKQSKKIQQQIIHHSVSTDSELCFSEASLSRLNTSFHAKTNDRRISVNQLADLCVTVVDFFEMKDEK